MARRALPILKNLPHHLGLGPTRSVTYMPRPGDGAPRAVTLIPGDGVGPLVTNAVEQVMQAMHAPVYFERYEVHGDMKSVPQEVFDSIRKNKVCMKGGLRTPVGGGVSSLNVQLRKELDLYASLVNCFNLQGLPTRHENVDIVVVRENTEGEYSGLEHEVVPGVVESLKVEVEMEDVEEDPVMDIDSGDVKDPLAVVEYIESIHAHYRETEVHCKFKLMVETLFLTINLIDRFLERGTVVRKKLQLVGVTA